MLPGFQWFFVTTATLLAVWLAIWVLAGEPSRRLTPYAFVLGIAPVVVGVALRVLKRRRLTTMLRTEMEGGMHNIGITDLDPDLGVERGTK